MSADSCGHGCGLNFILSEKINTYGEGRSRCLILSYI